MLVQDDEVKIAAFLELFTKKFSNFCQKAPVLLSFDVSNESVIVKELSRNIVQTFKFDHSKNVKQNIYIIKQWLLNNVYPVMVQEKKQFEDLTPDEVDKLIEKGYAPEKAAIMKKETKELIAKWRIEKVLVKKDELFVRNLNTDKEYRYKLDYPCTFFLKKMREDWTAEYAWKIFEGKSKLIDEIYAVEDNGEEN